MISFSMSLWLRRTVFCDTFRATRFTPRRNLHIRGHLEDVFIVGVARTPMGSFQKSLATCSAPVLGSVAIQGAVKRSGIDPKEVQECYMGLVLSAFMKQAPAKQAALMANLSQSIPCTVINKICSSGMKSIMIGALSIASGFQDVICAGGMESMSNVPFYLPRKPPTYGGATLYDGLVYDGLMDSKYHIHMGQCAEKTASDMRITRGEQDEYAKMSYERCQSAASSGIFTDEIVPVQVADKKAPNGYFEVTEDEEYKKVDFAKFSKLKPAFAANKETGTITAANASTLNDGAAATILTSAKFAKERGLKPIAKIIGFADAATDTIDFSIAPHLAVNKLLKETNLKTDDISLWEINEAFSAVALANIRLLNLALDRVNVHGGAVSCGHPLGMSGARITNHLALRLKSGEKGIAAICNGGGGASAILLEKL